MYASPRVFNPNAFRRRRPAVGELAFRQVAHDLSNLLHRSQLQTDAAMKEIAARDRIIESLFKTCEQSNHATTEAVAALKQAMPTA